MLCGIDYRNKINVLVLSTKTRVHGGELGLSILEVKLQAERVFIVIMVEELTKMVTPLVLGQCA